MEYESNEAKKLIKLLESSEEQERAYWLRRTKIAVLTWLGVLAIAILTMVVVMFGVSESGRYVSFRLYYLKTETDDDGKDVVKTAYEERKATIYETISNIMPPMDIKGYTFNGKYYNSSNMEVEIDPASNIANALTYENVIYMQYTLAHYKLTIRTDAADIVEGDDATTKVFETKDKAIGYNKRMYIVPSEQINGSNFAQDYADYKSGKKNLTYVDNNFLYLYAINYANVNTSAAKPVLNDIDGRANYHISGFRYFYENKTYEYSFKAVNLKGLDKKDFGNTYLVIKTVTDRYGNIIESESCENFSNGYAPNYIKSASDDTKVMNIDADGNYITTGEEVDDARNANIFHMPDVDLAVSLVWEADNRYLILVDTLDDYSWDRIFDGKGYDAVKTSYELNYNTVKDYLATAEVDGVNNDWDTLESDYSSYNIDWAKAVVLEGIANNTNVIRFINNNGVAGSSVATLNPKASGGYYYPYYKYGYQIDNASKWQIYTKTSTGGAWNTVDLNTTITSGYASNCILIRPNWKAISYEYRFGLSGGEYSTPTGTSFGSYKGYSQSNGLALYNKLTEGNKLPWGENNTDFLYVSKRGYTFVGWEIDCNLKFNYSDLLSDAKDGSKEYDSYIDFVKNDDEKNVLVYNPTFLYRGNKYNAVEDGSLKYIRANSQIAENKAQLWYRSEIIDNVNYNFYYFGTQADLMADKASDMRLPMGYYVEGASRGTFNAVWDIIDYHIDLQLSNGLDNSELVVTNTTLVSANYNQVEESTFGYNVVYGLRDYNDIYERITYINQNDDAVYENQVVVKQDGTSSLNIKYNIDDVILLPTATELYRRGYDLLGYDIYESGVLVRNARFGNGKTVIVINGSGNMPNNYLNISNLAGAVTIIPVWQVQTYTISYNGDTSNQQNIDTIINYDSQYAAIKEQTHSVVLNNVDGNNYVISDASDSTKSYTFNRAAGNVVTYNNGITGSAVNDTIVRNYIKLNDWYSNSQFNIHMQFSRNNGYTKYVDLLASNNSRGDCVDAINGQDKALFDVLDDSSYLWMLSNYNISNGLPEDWFRVVKTDDLTGKRELNGNLLDITRTSEWLPYTDANWTYIGEKDAFSYVVNGSKDGYSRQWITNNTYYRADQDYTLVSQVIDGNNISNNFIGITLYDKDYNDITYSVDLTKSEVKEMIKKHLTYVEGVNGGFIGWNNTNITFDANSDNNVAIFIKDLANVTDRDGNKVAYFRVSTAMETKQTSATGTVRMYMTRGLLDSDAATANSATNVHYYLNLNNRYPAHSRPLYVLETYTDNAGVQRQRYVYETTIYEGNDGGCYTNDFTYQLPLAKVRVYKEYINGEMYYCLEFLGLTADVNYSIDSITRDVVENRMLSNPSELTNPNSKLDVWMSSNESTKRTFEADLWYLIYNYNQLKAIIEYNRTHTNKIYYVLVTTTTGATYDVYDVLNMANEPDLDDPGLQGGILYKSGNDLGYISVGKDRENNASATNDGLSYVGNYNGYTTNPNSIAESGNVTNAIKYTNSIGSDFYFSRETGTSYVQDADNIYMYVEPLSTISYYCKRVAVINYTNATSGNWTYTRPAGPYNLRDEYAVASQMYYSEITKDDELYKSYYIPAAAFGNGRQYPGVPDVSEIKSKYGELGTKTSGWILRGMSNTLYNKYADPRANTKSPYMSYYHYNRQVYSSDGDVKRVTANGNTTIYQHQRAVRYSMLDQNGSGVYYTLKGQQYKATIEFPEIGNVLLDGVKAKLGANTFLFYAAKENVNSVDYTLDTTKSSLMPDGNGAITYTADGSSKFYNSVNLPVSVSESTTLSVGARLSSAEGVSGYTTEALSGAESDEVKFHIVMGSVNNSQLVDLSGYNNYRLTNDYGTYAATWYRPTPSYYDGVTGKELANKIFLPYNYASTTEIGKTINDYSAMTTGSNLRGVVSGAYTFDTYSRTSLTFHIELTGKYSQSSAFDDWDIDISNNLKATDPDLYAANLARYTNKLKKLQDLIAVKLKSGDTEYSSSNATYNCGIRFFNEEGRPANARVVLIEGKAYVQVYLGWLIATGRGSAANSNISDIAIYVNTNKLNEEVNHYDLSINEYVGNYNINVGKVLTTNGFSLDLVSQNNNKDNNGTYLFDPNIEINNGKIGAMTDAIAYGGYYRFVLKLDADYNRSIPAVMVTMGEDSKLVTAGAGEITINSSGLVSISVDPNDSSIYYIDIRGVNGHTTIDFQRIVKNSNSVAIYGSANQSNAAETNVTSDFVEGNKILGLGDTYLYNINNTTGSDNISASNVIEVMADFRDVYNNIYGSTIGADQGKDTFYAQLYNAYMSYLVENKATNTDILTKIFSNDAYIIKLTYNYSDTLRPVAYFVTNGVLKLGVVENGELNNATISALATTGAYSSTNNVGYTLQNGNYEASGSGTATQGFDTIISTYTITIDNDCVAKRADDVAAKNNITIFIYKPTIDIYTKGTKGTITYNPTNVKYKLGEKYAVKLFTAQQYADNLSGLVIAANNNTGITDLTSAIDSNGTTFSLDTTIFDGSIYYGAYIVVKAAAQTGYNQNAKIILTGYNADGSDLEYAIGTALYKADVTPATYEDPCRVDNNVFWNDGYYYYVICLKPAYTKAAGSSEEIISAANRNLDAVLNFVVSATLNNYDVTAEGGLAAADKYSIVVSGTENDNSSTEGYKYRGYKFAGLDAEGNEVDLSNNRVDVVKYTISHDDTITMTIALAAAYTNSAFTMHIVNDNNQVLYTLTRLAGDNTIAIAKGITSEDNVIAEGSVAIVNGKFELTITNVTTNIKLVGDGDKTISDALSLNAVALAENIYGTTSTPTNSEYGSTNTIYFGYKEYYEQNGLTLSVNNAIVTIAGLTNKGNGIPNISTTYTNGIIGLGIKIGDKIYVWDGTRYKHIDEWGTDTYISGTHQLVDNQYVFTYSDQGENKSIVLFEINYDVNAAQFELLITNVVADVTIETAAVAANDYVLAANGSSSEIVATILGNINGSYTDDSYNNDGTGVSKTLPTTEGELSTSIILDYASTAKVTINIPTRVGLDDGGLSLIITATKWDGTKGTLNVTGLVNSGDPKLEYDESKIFGFNQLSNSYTIETDKYSYQFELIGVYADITFTIGGLGKAHTLTLDTADLVAKSDVTLQATYTQYNKTDDSTKAIEDASISITGSESKIESIAHNTAITLNIGLTKGAIIDLTGKSIGDTIDLGDNNIIELVNAGSTPTTGNIALVFTSGDIVLSDTNVQLAYYAGINANHTLNLGKLISEKIYTLTVSADQSDALKESNNAEYTNELTDEYNHYLGSGKKVVKYIINPKYINSNNVQFNVRTSIMVLSTINMTENEQTSTVGVAKILYSRQDHSITITILDTTEGNITIEITQLKQTYTKIDTNLDLLASDNYGHNYATSKVQVDSNGFATYTISDYLGNDLYTVKICTGSGLYYLSGTEYYSYKDNYQEPTTDNLYIASGDSLNVYLEPTTYGKTVLSSASELVMKYNNASGKNITHQRGNIVGTNKELYSVEYTDITTAPIYMYLKWNVKKIEIDITGKNVSAINICQGVDADGNPMSLKGYTTSSGLSEITSDNIARLSLYPYQSLQIKYTIDAKYIRSVAAEPNYMSLNDDFVTYNGSEIGNIFTSTTGGIVNKTFVGMLGNLTKASSIVFDDNDLKTDQYSYTLPYFENAELSNITTSSNVFTAEVLDNSTSITIASITISAIDANGNPINLIDRYDNGAIVLPYGAVVTTKIELTEASSKNEFCDVVIPETKGKVLGVNGSTALDVEYKGQDGTYSKPFTSMTYTKSVGANYGYAEWTMTIEDNIKLCSMSGINIQLNRYAITIAKVAGINHCPVEWTGDAFTTDNLAVVDSIYGDYTQLGQAEQYVLYFQYGSSVTFATTYTLSNADVAIGANGLIGTANAEISNNILTWSIDSVTSDLDFTIKHYAERYTLTQNQSENRLFGDYDNYLYIKRVDDKVITFWAGLKATDSTIIKKLADVNNVDENDIYIVTIGTDSYYRIPLKQIKENVGNKTIAFYYSFEDFETTNIQFALQLNRYYDNVVNDQTNVNNQQNTTVVLYKDNKDPNNRVAANEVKYNGSRPLAIYSNCSLGNYTIYIPQTDTYSADIVFDNEYFDTTSIQVMDASVVGNTVTVNNQAQMVLEEISKTLSEKDAEKMLGAVSKITITLKDDYTELDKFVVGVRKIDGDGKLEQVNIDGKNINDAYYYKFPDLDGSIVYTGQVTTDKIDESGNYIIEDRYRPYTAGWLRSKYTDGSQPVLNANNKDNPLAYIPFSLSDVLNAFKSSTKPNSTEKIDRYSIFSTSLQTSGTEATILINYYFNIIQMNKVEGSSNQYEIYLYTLTNTPSGICFYITGVESNTYEVKVTKENDASDEKISSITTTKVVGSVDKAIGSDNPAKYGDEVTIKVTMNEAYSKTTQLTFSAAGKDDVTIDFANIYTKLIDGKDKYYIDSNCTTELKFFGQTITSISRIERDSDNANTILTLKFRVSADIACSIQCDDDHIKIDTYALNMNFTDSTAGLLDSNGRILAENATDRNSSEWNVEKMYQTDILVNGEAWNYQDRIPFNAKVDITFTPLEWLGKEKNGIEAKDIRLKYAANTYIGGAINKDSDGVFTFGFRPTHATYDTITINITASRIVEDVTVRAIKYVGVGTSTMETIPYEVVDQYLVFNSNSLILSDSKADNSSTYGIYRGMTITQNDISKIMTTNPGKGLEYAGLVASGGTGYTLFDFLKNESNKYIDTTETISDGLNNANGYVSGVYQAVYTSSAVTVNVYESANDGANKLQDSDGNDVTISVTFGKTVDLSNVVTILQNTELKKYKYIQSWRSESDNNFTKVFSTRDENNLDEFGNIKQYIINIKDSNYKTIAKFFGWLLNGQKISPEYENYTLQVQMDMDDSNLEIGDIISGGTKGYIYIGSGNNWMFDISKPEVTSYPASKVGSLYYVVINDILYKLSDVKETKIITDSGNVTILDLVDTSTSHISKTYIYKWNNTWDIGTELPNAPRPTEVITAVKFNDTDNSSNAYNNKYYFVYNNTLIGFKLEDNETMATKVPNVLSNSAQYMVTLGELQNQLGLTGNKIDVNNYLSGRRFYPTATDLGALDISNVRIGTNKQLTGMLVSSVKTGSTKSSVNITGQFLPGITDANYSNVLSVYQDVLEFHDSYRSGNAAGSISSNARGLGIASAKYTVVSEVNVAVEYSVNGTKLDDAAMKTIYSYYTKDSVISIADFMNGVDYITQSLCNGYSNSAYIDKLFNTSDNYANMAWQWIPYYFDTTDSKYKELSYVDGDSATKILGHDVSHYATNTIDWDEVIKKYPDLEKIEYQLVGERGYSSNVPYEISDINDWNYIVLSRANSDNLPYWKTVTASQSSVRYFKQTGNLVLGQASYYCNFDTAIAYDGGNNTITVGLSDGTVYPLFKHLLTGSSIINLNIAIKDSGTYNILALDGSADSYGLIAHTANAGVTLENVTIGSGTIQQTSSDTTKRYYLTSTIGLIGYDSIKINTINQVNNNSNLYVPNNAEVYIAGIIWAQSSTNLERCSNSGALSAGTNGNVNGIAYVGNPNNAIEVNAKYCYNIGVIKGINIKGLFRFVNVEGGIEFCVNGAEINYNNIDSNTSYLSEIIKNKQNLEMGYGLNDNIGKFVGLASIGLASEKKFTVDNSANYSSFYSRVNGANLCAGLVSLDTNIGKAIFGISNSYNVGSIDINHKPYNSTMNNNGVAGLILVGNGTTKTVNIESITNCAVGYEITKDSYSGGSLDASKFTDTSGYKSGKYVKKTGENTYTFVDTNKPVITAGLMASVLFNANNGRTVAYETNISNVYSNIATYRTIRASGAMFTGAYSTININNCTNYNTNLSDDEIGVTGATGVTAGIFQGNGDKVNITNCTNYSDVTQGGIISLTSAKTTNDGSYFGKKLEGKITITNCTNKGKVNQKVNGFAAAGILSIDYALFNEGTTLEISISDCTNEGEVTNTLGAAGGILEGDIFALVGIRYVDSENNASTTLSKVFSNISSDNSITITNCTNSAAIIGKDVASGIAATYYNSVGTNTININNSTVTYSKYNQTYNDGVTIGGTKYNDYHYFQYANGSVDISSCKNTGNVSVTDGTTYISNILTYRASRLTNGTGAKPSDWEENRNTNTTTTTAVAYNNIDITYSLTYETITDDGGEVTGYAVTGIQAYDLPAGTLMDVIIPGTYNDETNGEKPVVKISDNAFNNCVQLASISIPDSVISIGNYAFAGCTGLTGITIPNSVVELGHAVFFECGNLEYLYIPASVKSIGLKTMNAEFITGTKLTTITTTLNAKEGLVWEFDDDVWYYNVVWATTEDPDNYKKVLIGKKLTIAHIINYANYLQNNNDVEEVVFTKESALQYNAINDNSGYEASIKSDCKQIVTSITIPSTYLGKPVTKIADNGFDGCTQLTSVTIPNTIKTIGNAAFANCTKLKTVTFAANSVVSSIGASAFSSCTSLQNINIPGTVSEYRDNLFYGCTSLTILEVASGTTTLGLDIVRGCTNLRQLTLATSVKNIELNVDLTSENPDVSYLTIYNTIGLNNTATVVYGNDDLSPSVTYDFSVIVDQWADQYGQHDWHLTYVCNGSFGLLELLRANELDLNYYEVGENITGNSSYTGVSFYICDTDNDSSYYATITSD